MLSVQELIETHHVEMDEQLDRQATVPVGTGFQRQGDILVRPAATRTREFKAVPAEGVAVLKAEGANTHLLLADGDVAYAPNLGSGMHLGYLRVAEGATAVLAHPEHGFAAIGAGDYAIGRQQEQREMVAYVVD
jgi:hypothetical protein